jgi:iron(III) transport system ATP-binding protein
MAEVRLQQVSKSYGGHPVVRDLDLTIRDGECFTLLGPSGCGKTVILRLIAGFEQPDKGEIFIGDTLVSSHAKRVHLPPEARRIGVVFQDYAVWPHKSVFDNVAYPLQIQKIPKEEASRRTGEAIRQVNLTGLERRLPYQLSGGQQQRVALARALVSGPEIMLLDEPLCNLDANLREEMRFEIKELQRKTGVTILYVTHDQEVALALSDRVAIMDRQGTIRQVGPPDEIYEKPADSFVFRFMGVSNFIPVEPRDGKMVVRGSSVAIHEEVSAGPGGAKPAVAGCRPGEIDLLRSETETRGRVRKRAFLGPSIEYWIDLGGREIRVEQDTHEALAANLVFDEGEACGLRFSALKWFDSEGPGEEV